MNFIERFIDAILGLRPRKRTIFDDLEDAKRRAGIPVTRQSNRWY